MVQFSLRKVWLFNSFLGSMSYPSICPAILLLLKFYPIGFCYVQREGQHFRGTSVSKLDAGRMVVSLKKW